MTQAGPRVSVPPAGADADVDHLMSAARWAQAAALLESRATKDLRTQLKLRLARNMAAMQAHRPQVYAVLTQTPTVAGRYQLATASDGNLSIVLVRTGGGGPCFLSDGGQPSRGVATIARLCADPANLYHVFALLGAGDGYILTWLAQNPRADEAGMTMPVYVIEPEPEVIYQAMMIHDWSGPGGPIANPRFVWALGPRIDAMLEQALGDEPQLRPPTIELQQSVIAAQIVARVRAVTVRHKSAEEAIRPRVAAYYKGHTREMLVRLLGVTPPRPPRILCMTSRFTTVVQHVARDMAAAMSALGWQAELLIEKDAHLAVGVTALLRKVEEFKPDVVFTVNHVRAELFDAFPPELPFVSWIQDHLPTLMDRATGRGVGLRDYILSEAPEQYVERFGYPVRQCIAMTKLTACAVPGALPGGLLNADGCEETGRRPVLQASPSDGEDLVYVSHASGLPEQQYADLIARYKDRRREDRPLIEHCGRKLLDLYAGGGCCPTSDDMHELIRQGARELSLPALDDTHRDVLCQALYVPLNNTLYRQRALGWVAEAADRLGLRLGIYGGGSDKHPRFARYARGKVAFGPDLAALTRRSRINLQIVPYAFYHQRLFDGLMAGGFFLVMANPADAPHGRRLQGHGLIPHSLPRVDDVCFTDAEGLARQIVRYVGDAALRGEIIATQREYVGRHFTYEAGARRLVERIHGLIAAEETAGEARQESPTR